MPPPPPYSHINGYNVLPTPTRKNQGGKGRKKNKMRKNIKSVKNI